MSDLRTLKQLTEELEDLARDPHPLYIIWIDITCGQDQYAEWWWNELTPRPLADCTIKAAQLRAKGWPTQVLPRNQNPRPDGRWDNP